MDTVHITPASISTTAAATPSTSATAASLRSGDRSFAMGAASAAVSAKPRSSTVSRSSERTRVGSDSRTTVPTPAAEAAAVSSLANRARGCATDEV